LDRLCTPYRILKSAEAAAGIEIDDTPAWAGVANAAVTI